MSSAATLIEKNMIPDDVTIQVLTQSREHIIKKTFEALDRLQRTLLSTFITQLLLHRESRYSESPRKR